MSAGCRTVFPPSARATITRGRAEILADCISLFQCVGPIHRPQPARSLRDSGCIDFSVEAFWPTRIGVYDRGGWGSYEVVFQVIAPLATMAHVEPRLSRPCAATIPRLRSSRLEPTVVACILLLPFGHALRIGRLTAAKSGCSFGCGDAIWPGLLHELGGQLARAGPVAA